MTLTPQYGTCGVLVACHRFGICWPKMEKLSNYGNMPNLQYLLILYPVVAILYAVFAFGPRAHRQDKRELKALLVPAAIPLFTALVIVFVFLVAGAARTVQFNVGRGLGMMAWSLWVTLWPPLSLLNLLNGIGVLIWLGYLAVSRDLWLKIAVACAVLSAVALATVYYNFPTA